MLRFIVFLLLLLVTGASSLYARTANLPPPNYKRAFAALDAHHPELAFSLAAHLDDPVLNKVLRAYYYAAPGNNATFSELSTFIQENPDWPPVHDIRAVAEQKIPTDAEFTFITQWFLTYPPITLPGFYRYMNALLRTGQEDLVRDAVRTRWVKGDFRDDELAPFYNRFATSYLTPSDNWARLDRLAWQGDEKGARAIYRIVDPNLRLVAEARFALANQKFGAGRALAEVPSSYQSDPGLLYERLRWLRRNNRDADADDILLHAPEDLGRPDLWWEERQTMARRAMERRDFDLAYRLAENSGDASGKGLLEADFLAGWLALRFLNQPDIARSHFENLFQHATTPVSRARGAYWLGRSLEALDDKAGAEQAYETAGGISITFYGQLALTRLYAHPTISAPPEAAIPASVRNAFFAQFLVKAVEHLHKIGEPTLARRFFHAGIDGAKKRSDFVLLSELAYEIKRPDLAIEAVKAANLKNILVAAGGFPVIDHRLPAPPDPAFTHALIRQESMFNPDASSPVGAQGLMQLMPQTAKGEAKKIGVRYRKDSLDDPDYNLKLGTSFVQNQIDAFNGSYILALAGYNAGPGRTREWMSEIGDPRNREVDVIDWIELIPVPETRNYVQRIIENLQIYRARLNGGKAQLLILNDLRR